MKLYITTLALLALQNTNVSADTSSTISDLTSRLESIKNAASAMVEEISQKESELMNEEFASQKENELMNEIVSEPESDVMYKSMEQKKSKIFDVIDTIPDNEVNEKVHKLMDMGKFAEAQFEVRNFLDDYIAQADSEKKAELQANKDQIMRMIDEGFEEMLSEEEEDMEELEFEDTELEGNSTFLTYKQAKDLIDDIPDKEVNEKVHDLIEKHDAAGAEDVVHEFFDKYVGGLKDEKAKEDMMANKDSIIDAVDTVIEHEAGKDSEDEEKDMEELEFEGEITFTPAEAKAMIMGIPDETVKSDILDKIEQKDVEGADKAIDDFFKAYVEKMDDEAAKEQMTAEAEALLSALHGAVEQWDEIEDEDIEDSENSYDTNSEVEFEGLSSQFNEILSTLPDKEIRSNIIERIEEGNIDDAELQFKEFLSKYLSEMPQGQEKEKVSGSESELMNYISLQFQTMRDAQDKTEFEEEAKEDTKEEMKKVLDEIAENQLLIEEALEKLGGK